MTSASHRPRHSIEQSFENVDARRPARVIGIGVVLSAVVLVLLALTVRGVVRQGDRPSSGGGTVANVTLWTPPSVPARRGDSTVVVAAPPAAPAPPAPTVTGPDLTPPIRPQRAEPGRADPFGSPTAIDRSPESSPSPERGALDNALPGRMTAVFKSSLESHIARFRRYPDVARRQHQQGIVRIAFEMDRRGGIIEVRLASSSGFPVLDAEAMETVKRAAPLPAIPPGLPDRVSVQLPIEFALWARPGHDARKL